MNMKKLLKLPITAGSLLISLFIVTTFFSPIFANDTIVADTTIRVQLKIKKDSIDSLALKRKIVDSTLINKGILSSKDSSEIMDSIIIGAVGDLMIGTHFPSKNYLPPGELCSSLPDTIMQLLSKPDITFGNLEGCFLDEGPVVKRCSDISKCYAFKMPEKYSECFHKAGFDFLSLANNHSGDFGYKGRKKTIQLLDSFNIAYAGLLKNPYAIIEKDSVKYGMAAFSPNKGTVSIHDYDNAAKLVSFLDDTCDIVIVSFHGGAEGSKHQHVKGKNEFYYGEDRGNVKKFSYFVIDNGADLVFGHGPHVTRAVDIYKDRFIIYSLGNFATYGRFNLSGPNGIAPLLSISVTGEGKFISGEIIPIKQIVRGIPVIDPNAKVIKKIQDLTKIDFPESDLQIHNDGLILKK